MSPLPPRHPTRTRRWPLHLLLRGLPGLRAPERVRRHLWISGRVQGVFFRDRCQAEASAHGVAGWVTNRLDGRVEVVLEGDPAAVAAVEGWCRHGPRRAAVTAVEAADEAPTGASAFQVR